MKNSGFGKEIKFPSEKNNFMTTASSAPKIIFVYNADGGVLNLLSDVAHKIFSPQTYSCNLCSLTHSNFGMKAEWKDFLDTLENPLEFLHADEFKAEYQSKKVALPAIFREKEGEPSLLIDAAAINECRSMDDLKRLLKSRLSDATG